MFRTRVAALLAMAALAGCSDSAGGGFGGDPVKPAVAPPALEPPHTAPASPDRSEVVRIVLKEPQALPATQIDAYKQKPGIVDILWLIDNSGSMNDERSQLAGNFQNFLTTVQTSNTDFHIAVIATDQDLGAALHPSTDGTLIIDRNTPNANQEFGEMVTFPAGRVRWVQGLQMMKKFLSTPALQQGFLRPNAALAVISLSDGDDQSFSTVGYYARYLREVKGQGNENIVSFSTISGDVGTTPPGCQSQRDAQYWGSRAEASYRFTEMARRTGGVVGSICDLSFENTLTQIAEALNTLRKIFPLSLKPDPSTIQVNVNGAQIPRDATNGWTYVASVNAIEFLGTYVPPPAADIQIQYAIAP